MIKTKRILGLKSVQIKVQLYDVGKTEFLVSKMLTQFNDDKSCQVKRNQSDFQNCKTGKRHVTSFVSNLVTYSFWLIFLGAWNCHEGCRIYCLPSCKSSCCKPGAKDYHPDMMPGNME